MPEPDKTGWLVPIHATESAASKTAIGILAEGFARDPVMRFFVDGAPSNDPTRLRERIARALVKSHLASGEPLYGYLDQGAMIGCALVATERSAWRSLWGMIRSLPAWLSLPWPVVKRMNDYAKISQSGAPGCHFLTMIAMSHAARGQGHGGAFLRAIEAEHDPCRCWALDTENPDNVGLYQHMGYTLYDQVALGPVTVYKMKKTAGQ